MPLVTSPVIMSARTVIPAGAAPLQTSQPTETLELGRDLAGGRRPDLSKPVPFHVSMRVAGSLLPSLTGCTLALVNESEVQQGQWVGSKAVALPEVKHADVEPAGPQPLLTPLPLADWQDALKRDPAILAHLESHPDQLSYLTSQGKITSGQTLGEAVQVAGAATSGEASLNLALSVPGELVPSLNSMTLAFIPSAELEGQEWKRAPGSVAVAGQHVTAEPVPDSAGLFAPLSDLGGDMNASLWKVMPNVRRSQYNEQMVEAVLAEKGGLGELLAARGLDAAALKAAIREFPPFGPDALTPEQVADPSVRTRVAAGELVCSRALLLELEKELGAEKLQSMRQAIAGGKWKELSELNEECTANHAVWAGTRGLLSERKALAVLGGGQGDDTPLATFELMARRLSPAGNYDLGYQDPALTVGGAVRAVEKNHTRNTVWKWGSLAANAIGVAIDVALLFTGNVGGAVASFVGINGPATSTFFTARTQQAFTQESGDYWRGIQRAAREGDLALARHIQEDRKS